MRAVRDGAFEVGRERDDDFAFDRLDANGQCGSARSAIQSQVHVAVTAVGDDSGWSAARDVGDTADEPDPGVHADGRVQIHVGEF